MPPKTAFCCYLQTPLAGCTQHHLAKQEEKEKKKPLPLVLVALQMEKEKNEKL